MITPLETLAQTPHRQVPHCPVCGEPRDAGKFLCYPCWNSISDTDQRGLLRGDLGTKRAILRRLIEYRRDRLASLGILPPCTAGFQPAVPQASSLPHKS